MDRPLLIDFQLVVVPVGQSVQLVGPNLRRVGLVIGAPAVNRVDLAFRTAAVAGQGLALWPKVAPLQLVGEHWPCAIREGVQAAATGGPETLGVLDIFEA
jgi:hypothetical protein